MFLTSPFIDQAISRFDHWSIERNRDFTLSTAVRLPILVSYRQGNSVRRDSECIRSCTLICLADVPREVP